MAEVNYNREPTVSVHGVPKSQYDAGSFSQTQSSGIGTGTPPTGIMQDIKQHPVWAVTIAIGIIAILVMIYLWWQSQSGNNSNSSNLIDPTTGQPYALGNGNNPSAMYGSQLDADYQQMISNQNTMTGLLQSIQNSLSGGTSSSGGTGTVGGTPGVTTHNPGSTFKGATGVLHYETTGKETLSQIAAEFGLQSWNSIYAIPSNQKIFGNPMTAKQARGFKPTSGLVITLPGTTSTSAGSFWASHAG